MSRPIVFPMLRTLVLLIPLVAVSLRAQTPADRAAQPAPDAWVYFDAPLWDLANEGLPFRATLALPSRLDPLTRLMFGSEARWTFSAGYVKVYNSYDGATGVLKSRGGHAFIGSAGRQFFWDLPQAWRPFAPRIAVEFGINVASREFPADGTRTNFKLISGLQWSWRSKDQQSEWIAGVFWPHFSNANLHDRNAGYDGLVLRFGRSLRW